MPPLSTGRIGLARGQEIKVQGVSSLPKGPPLTLPRAWWEERMVGWGAGRPQADGPLTLPSPALGRGIGGGLACGRGGWWAGARVGRKRTAPSPCPLPPGERDRLWVGVWVERMVGRGGGEGERS